MSQSYRSKRVLGISKNTSLLKQITQNVIINLLPRLVSVTQLISGIKALSEETKMKMATVIGAIVADAASLNSCLSPNAFSLTTGSSS